MARRQFDYFMTHVDAGTHEKYATFSDSEFRCYHHGVLAIAAKAPIRGCLLVGEMEAVPEQIARKAGVNGTRIARATLEKAKAIGLLEQDDDLGCWRVHDWEDHNPAPKQDRTAAERAARYRARRRHAAVTPGVTPPSRRDDRDGHGPVTGGEVEGEVETAGSLRSPAERVTQIDRSKKPSQKADPGQLPDSLSPQLVGVAAGLLRRLRAVWDERGGNEPTLRGIGLAIANHPDRDHEQVMAELEHWALAGGGQSRPIKDWVRQFSAFLRNAPSAKATATRDGGPSGRDGERRERERRQLEALDRLAGGAV